MTTWIDLNLALAIHKLQIAEHGGDDGVRDVGLLESALARPLNIEVYEPGADIASLGAGYAYGINRNHPFVDGNKRTSYVVMETFFNLNGYLLTASEEEKYPIFLSVADGTFSEEELADWLRQRLSPE